MSHWYFHNSEQENKSVSHLANLTFLVSEYFNTNSLYTMINTGVF